MGIVVFQFGYPAFEMPGRHREDAGIDLPDDPFVDRRILVLNNANDLTVLAHDTSITIRRIQRHSQQPQLPCLCGSNQWLQCGYVRQRHIAVQHQRHALVRKLRQRLFHGVACPLLFGLENKGQSFIVQSLRNRLTTEPIHHAGLCRTQRMGGIHHVSQQGFACQLVQYLGKVRAHASALARCENQYF